MPVDSLCHLDCLQLRENVEGVVARAAAAGVGGRVSVRTRPSRFDHTRRIAERHASLRFAAGLHPCHVGEEPAPAVEDLLQLATHPRMAGIQSRNCPRAPKTRLRQSGPGLPDPKRQPHRQGCLGHAHSESPGWRRSHACTRSSTLPPHHALGRGRLAAARCTFVEQHLPLSSPPPHRPILQPCFRSLRIQRGCSLRPVRPVPAPGPPPRRPSRTGFRLRPRQGCPDIGRAPTVRSASADAHRTAVSDRPRIDAPARPAARTPATRPRFERRVRMTPRLPCAMVFPGAWPTPHPTPIE